MATKPLKSSDDESDSLSSSPSSSPSSSDSPSTRIDEIGEIPEPPTPVIDYPDPIIGPGGEAYGDAHTTPSEVFQQLESD